MESECAIYQNLKNPKLKYFTLKVKLVNNYNYFFVPKNLKILFDVFEADVKFL